MLKHPYASWTASCILTSLGGVHYRLIVLHFFILSPPDWQASHNGWLVLGLRPVWRSHGFTTSSQLFM